MLISVLAIDNPALIRSLLKGIIQADPELRLVDCAPDAFAARDLIKQHTPDVINLDVEMPWMGGLTFLNELIKTRPTPVPTISSPTECGSGATLRALELGAVDFIAKPRLGIAEGMQAYAEEIRAKLEIVTRVRLHRHAADAPALPESAAPLLSTERIIVLGVSTGGTEALKEMLLSLPTHSSGVVITQYVPPDFTHSFAGRLDRLTRLNVSEARDGNRILPGHALVAPGSHHMGVQRSGANYVVRLNRRVWVNGHRPTVDAMSESLARCAGRSLFVGLLTGVSKDGACGLLAIHRAGGYTLTQDEAICVVYGMPRETMELGAAEDVLSLERIAAALLQQAARRGSDNRLWTGPWLIRCAFSPPPATSSAETPSTAGPNHGPLPAHHHRDVKLMVK